MKENNHIKKFLMGTLATVIIEVCVLGFVEKHKIILAGIILFIALIYYLTVYIKHKKTSYMVATIAFVLFVLIAFFNTPFMIRKTNRYDIKDMSIVNEAIILQNYDRLYRKLSKNLNNIEFLLGKESKEYMEHKVLLAKLDFLKRNGELGLNHLDDIKYDIEENKKDMQELYYMYIMTKADILFESENYSEVQKYYELLESLFIEKPLSSINFELYSIYTKMSKNLFYLAENEIDINMLCEKINNFEKQNISIDKKDYKNQFLATDYTINNIVCNLYLSCSYMKFGNKTQADKYYGRINELSKEFVGMLTDSELLHLSIISNYLECSEDVQFYVNYLKNKTNGRDVQLLDLYNTSLNMDNMNFEEKEKHLLYCMNLFSGHYELVANAKCKIAELYIDESTDDALAAIDVAEKYITAHVQEFNNVDELILTIHYLKYKYYEQILDFEQSEKHYIDFKNLYKQVYNKEYISN